MDKKIFSIFFGLAITFFCSFPNPVFATATSNSVISKVGNPTDPEPVINNGGLAKAAQDLVNAYKSCGSYANYDTVTGSCFKNALVSDQYPSSAIDKAVSYYRYNSPDCIECSGFVKQAIELAYGDGDPRLGGSKDGIDGSTPWSWTAMNNNGHILKNVGTSNPQVGDIAVNQGDAGEAIHGDHGHISIVATVNGSKFTAFESNWSDGGKFSACHISDNIEHPWVRHTYTFFRQQ